MLGNPLGARTNGWQIGFASSPKTSSTIAAACHLPVQLGEITSCVTLSPTKREGRQLPEESLGLINSSSSMSLPPDTNDNPQMLRHSGACDSGCRNERAGAVVSTKKLGFKDRATTRSNNESQLSAKAACITIRTKKGMLLLTTTTLVPLCRRCFT